MPNNEGEDRLVVLTDKINSLSLSLSECFIFRVHSQLRDVNKVAYDPVLVSIGPYHRGNEKLRVTEEYKLRYLRNFTYGNDNTLETYFSAMKLSEGEARKYYEEPIGLDTDEFTEMLLLDSCFIILTIQQFNDEAPPVEGRNSFWMYTYLQRDLMLFENQLPFFVILKMLNLLGHPLEYRQHFINMALNFFSDLIKPKLPAKLDIGGIKHLLGMIHEIWLTSKLLENQVPPGWQHIPSVSKLKEAGVKFEKAEEGVLFNISFRNGVMRIPQLEITDMTECFLRNLIAYEQYKIATIPIFVTDYAALLDRLISSPKDVELLCESGILLNWLGDDKAVSDMFNKIVDSALTTLPFYYGDFCNQVNTFYNSKTNRRMAKLKRNHLNSPWAVISIAAAIILLLLTVTQTVFAILSH